jgi:hypothetical protein
LVSIFSHGIPDEYALNISYFHEFAHVWAIITSWENGRGKLLGFRQFLLQYRLLIYRANFLAVPLEIKIPI